MKTWNNLLLGAVICAALLLAGNLFLSPAAAMPQRQQPPPPDGEEQYFPETGFYVSGPFLEFYRDRGGSRIFGYPRTRLYSDARLGHWVQYFDNVRMEWHPTNPDPYKVQLGLLGVELGMQTSPIPSNQIPIGNSFRRYFPETGHVVSFAFLVFYDENGGLDIFGYPITEPMMENDRVVQYFQRGRMEWHAERPQDDRVVLGSLGIQIMPRAGIPADQLNRENSPIRVTQSSDVARISAYVRNVITGREGFQTVFVYMVDDERRPVAGVTATVVVRFPSGPVTYAAGPSDSRGIASVTFPIHSLPAGRKIIIDVSVPLSNEQSLTTQTFFVPWY